MARYENLPIYKKSMELAVLAEQVVREFPRYHKYTLGQELRVLTRQLTVGIIRANSQPQSVER
ncbi:MAG: four helix bundle protein [SAR324 cluster bacterium]|nr:four helix bundle protein [SAR324 cluster bacterium]